MFFVIVLSCVLLFRALLFLRLLTVLVLSVGGV